MKKTAVFSVSKPFPGSLLLKVFLSKLLMLWIRVKLTFQKAVHSWLSNSHSDASSHALEPTNNHQESMFKMFLSFEGAQ